MNGVARLHQRSRVGHRASLSFAGCTNLQLICQLDQHQRCLSGTCSHLHRVDSVYKQRCCIQCALLHLHHYLHNMPTHRRSTELTAFTNSAAVFNVRSCSCITTCTTCLLTDGQLIKTVMNAADPRLHFAVKECATVAIALSTWQMTWRVRRWPLDPGQRCSSAQRP